MESVSIIDHIQEIKVVYLYLCDRILLLHMAHTLQRKEDPCMKDYHGDERKETR
jgi:hypothetical protein